MLQPGMIDIHETPKRPPLYSPGMSYSMIIGSVPNRYHPVDLPQFPRISHMFRSLVLYGRLFPTLVHDRASLHAYVQWDLCVPMAPDWGKPTARCEVDTCSSYTFD